MKERIIAIVFLFVLCAPVATIYTFLQFEKSAIRRDIKGRMIAGMEHEELTLLKFTKEEVKTQLLWEHSKEFEYNGQMYDVVSQEIKGDSIFYRCWWDYKETKLNKKLKKMVASAFDQNEDNRALQKSFFSYLGSFFCTDLFKWEVEASFNSEVVYKNVLHQTIFNSIKITPPIPPPKLS